MLMNHNLKKTDDLRWKKQYLYKIRKILLPIDLHEEKDAEQTNDSLRSLQLMIYDFLHIRR